MKLYEIKAHWYVIAENEMDAKWTRPTMLEECVTSVMEATAVESDWADVLPFGDDPEGDRTCAEVLQGGRDDTLVATNSLGCDAGGGGD